mmetsp:Transcript_20916/g.47485  ORF Transcript_20916/g.47485 Transcript_20916/m.47485 type:complete len:1287 (-) Transcript_20916:30-3890(-)
MGLVSVWLRSIGLADSTVARFKATGIDTPSALAGLSLSDYDELGVEDQDSRAKLFYLVQRIRLAVRGDDDGDGSIDSRSSVEGGIENSMSDPSTVEEEDYSVDIDHEKNEQSGILPDEVSQSQSLPAKKSPLQPRKSDSALSKTSFSGASVTANRRGFGSENNKNDELFKESFNQLSKPSRLKQPSQSLSIAASAEWSKESSKITTAEVDNKSSQCDSYQLIKKKIATNHKTLTQKLDNLKNSCGSSVKVHKKKNNKDSHQLSREGIKRNNSIASKVSHKLNPVEELNGNVKNPCSSRLNTRLNLQIARQEQSSSSTDSNGSNRSGGGYKSEPARKQNIHRQHSQRGTSNLVVSCCATRSSAHQQLAKDSEKESISNSNCVLPYPKTKRSELKRYEGTATTESSKTPGLQRNPSTESSGISFNSGGRSQNSNTGKSSRLEQNIENEKKAQCNDKDASTAEIQVSEFADTSSKISTCMPRRTSSSYRASSTNQKKSRRASRIPSPKMHQNDLASPHISSNLTVFEKHGEQLCTKSDYIHNDQVKMLNSCTTSRISSSDQMKRNIGKRNRRQTVAATCDHSSFSTNYSNPRRYSNNTYVQRVPLTAPGSSIAHDDVLSQKARLTRSASSLELKKKKNEASTSRVLRKSASYHRPRKSTQNRSYVDKTETTGGSAVFVHGQAEDRSWGALISKQRKMIAGERDDDNETHCKGSLYEDDDDSECSVDEDMRIRVVVRKRPMSKFEKTNDEVDVIQPVGGRGKLFVHQPRTRVDLSKEVETLPFAYDHVFTETANNFKIYRRAIRNLIPTAFIGGRASVFAYGQTGSGKTFTMMGSNMTGSNACLMDDKLNCGLYYLAAQDVFKLAERDEFSHLTIGVSLFEIYGAGGKLFDLLNKRKLVKCLEDNKGKVCFPGLSEHVIDSAENLMEVIESGAENRSTGTTSANADSSRSHAVLQLTLRKQNKAEKGRLTFIDLAGSERGADTDRACKTTRTEGQEINRSLLALKEVIRALAIGGSAQHIPFRGSKLTQVLKDSFVGSNTRTAVIACIAPNLSNCEHTLNTIRYVDRIKQRDPNLIDLQTKERSKKNFFRQATDLDQYWQTQIRTDTTSELDRRKDKAVVLSEQALEASHLELSFDDKTRQSGDQINSDFKTQHLRETNDLEPEYKSDLTDFNNFRTSNTTQQLHQKMTQPSEESLACISEASDLEIEDISDSENPLSSYALSSTYSNPRVTNSLVKEAAENLMSMHRSTMAKMMETVKQEMALVNETDTDAMRRYVTHLQDIQNVSSNS